MREMFYSIAIYLIYSTIALFAASCDTTDAAPQIEFSKEIINVQGIKYGQNNDLAFTIYNKGQRDLVIKDIYSSCFCTNPAVTKRTISPNDSSIVKVVYRPAVIGPDMQTITIHSNANGSPHVVVVRAKVVDR